MKKVISKFENEYRFLSNFYPCQIRLSKETYHNAEAAFQAAKCSNAKDREKYQNCENPAEAKRLGKTERLPENWSEKSVDAMRKVVSAKFCQNADLRAKLLATKNAELVEGNSWHDNKWGACDCEKCADAEKQNLLGKILMEIRTNLDPEATDKPASKKESTEARISTKHYTEQQLKTLEYQMNFVLKLLDSSINWNMSKIGKLRPLAEEDGYFGRDIARFESNAQALAALKKIVCYGVSPYIGKQMDRPQLNLDKSQAYTISNQLIYIKKSLNATIEVMQDIQRIIERSTSEFVALEAFVEKEV